MEKDLTNIHFKLTSNSWRFDETYVKVKGMRNIYVVSLGQ